MSGIVLNNNIRNNLLALNNTSGNINKTENKLSTGLSVSNATDDAYKYFTAKALNDRASTLATRKDSIDQAVSSVTVATNSLSSMSTMVTQMEGITDSSRSGNTSQRNAYQKQLGTLVLQLNKLVGDSSYNGTNLLNSSTSTLSVYFSDQATSKLTVQGIDMHASKNLFQAASGVAINLDGLSGADTVGAFSKVGKFLKELGGFTDNLSGYSLSKATVLALYNSHADKMQLNLQKTVDNISAQAAVMGNNVAVLNVRLDFTNQYINSLQGGANKMTVADLNSESANLMSLNTRQSIATSALSMANQANQGVLQLLR